MAQPNVFEQVIQLISRSDFEASVHKHKGDKGIRTLDCWTWFGALLFGQLSGHDSIRAIERVFCHSNYRIKKLGMSSVCKSTLADANKTRPLEILDETLRSLVKQATMFSPGASKWFHQNVYLLDSTFINLCMSLCPWAKYQQKEAGIKLHTAIDLAGELPHFVVMDVGKVQDITIAKRELHLERGSTIVFDRGYLDQKWFSDLSNDGIFFVTRARKNNKFKVVESRPTDRTRGYLCDQIIYGKDRIQRRPLGKMRRISYVDPDTQKKLVFLTNRFDLSTEQVTELYKARWTVELFFKTLKQNLRIKKFLGTSFHSVKAQIYVALIAYVLVQLIRWVTKSHISITDTMAVIGTLLLLNEPLKRLLGEIPRTTRYPPSSQLMFAF
jgi:putative transposase